ncbi:MAG: response regulator transcription factor [Treponema sp.]|jgi:DNA-binding response OmpR family regulator|nr:response regulator transcription factor [Treponema sp.]
MKRTQTILVVDDEEKILGLLQSYLEASGYTALCARSGGEGIRLFEKNAVSLILLDLMLPDISGEKFCRKIRETSNIPIIMVSAKVEETDIIRGLKIGADDYVTKPFSPRQLMARVEAALRRAGDVENPQANPRQQSRQLLQYRGLIIDTERRSVTCNGKAIALTRDEYNILTLLMSRQAKIFTRDEILEAVKGGDYEAFDRVIDAHIKKLRAKIGDDSKSPTYITTVYGMGYRIGGTQ